MFRAKLYRVPEKNITGYEPGKRNEKHTKWNQLYKLIQGDFADFLFHLIVDPDG